MEKGNERSKTRQRSTKEIIGYSIQARDGECGFVDDFIVDTEGKWDITHAVVKIHKWLPGRRVLLPTAEMQKMSWGMRKVYTSLTINDIDNRPEYNAGNHNSSQGIVIN
jgi:hypothetical protein